MNQTSKIGIIVIVVIALVGVGFFAMQSMGQRPSAPSVVAVQNHDVVQEVQTTGVVRPVVEYNLSFGTSGLLAHVYAHKGDTVRAGQLLATLDASDIAMQRASANAVLVGDQQVAATNLANAQQALDQLKKADSASIANATQKVLDARTYLNKVQDIFTDVSNDGDIDTTSVTYITAAQSLAAAKNSYNEAVTSLHALQAAAKQSESAAQSQIASAQVSSTLKSGIINSSGDISVNQAQLGYQNALLNKTVLKAPAAGVITSEDVQQGEYASPAQSTMTVISTALEVEAKVSEADVTKMHIGGIAHVTFDAIGLTESFDAKITSIDSVASSENGVASYGVTLEIMKSDSRIKPGMTANVAIPVAEKRNVLAVPADAVFAHGTEFFVNIPDSGNASHKQTVTLGVHGTNGYDEVVSGVSSGQSVLSFSTK